MRGKSRRLQRVLTDFGVKHSYAASCKRVKEHYGFSLNASAVRTETLRHARRAAEQLERQYSEPFRVLPAQGVGHVIGEADGTLVCTVEPGKRNVRRPRQWREMRLVAAQAQGRVKALYAEPPSRAWSKPVGAGAIA